FYQNTLDYRTAGHWINQTFNDLDELAGGKETMSRSILRNMPAFHGALSKLLGPTTIELIEVKTATRKKIFEDRYWGDLGFIHVCYDMCSMQSHTSICTETGYPLTVNSGDSFEMGKTSGQFAYNEDPDGSLIEYVETHKVPIVKNGMVFGFTKEEEHQTFTRLDDKVHGI
ncbi:MAG TPA: hypothetical protein VNA26_04215, partial [Chitinophagaceae bacterium]|nr:hypothetical protein [Chitinophagaceae bacterium]